MLVEDEIKHNVLRHHQGSKAQKQGARSLKSLNNKTREAQLTFQGKKKLKSQKKVAPELS
jgi:hypothetical protein